MKTAVQNSFDGVVEVCCHRVTFRYWDFDAELDERLEKALTEEAESRAQQLIIEGCVSGDLNCSYVDDNDTDEEIQGWWEIKVGSRND